MWKINFCLTIGTLFHWSMNWNEVPTLDYLLIPLITNYGWRSFDVLSWAILPLFIRTPAKEVDDSHFLYDRNGDPVFVLPLKRSSWPYSMFVGDRTLVSTYSLQLLALIAYRFLFWLHYYSASVHFPFTVSFQVYYNFLCDGSRTPFIIRGSDSITYEMKVDIVQTYENFLGTIEGIREN